MAYTTKYISLKVLLFAFIFTLHSVAQNDFNDKSTTLIFANQQDSIFCNPVGRSFAFILKNNLSIDTLLLEESDYNAINQCVAADLDNDKLNEAIISFGDEGFYDLLVYKIRKEKNRYIIKKVFAKTGIDNPRDLKVPYLANTNLNTVLFYSINDDAKTVRYKLSYNVHLRKYQIHSIK